MKKVMLTLICLSCLILFSACTSGDAQEEAPAPPPAAAEQQPADGEAAAEFGVAAEGSFVDLSTARTYLAVEPEVYPLDAEVIPYVLIHDSAEELLILPSPRFQYHDGVDWQTLEAEGVGFCGTPTSVYMEWADDLPLAWYEGQLQPGRYRLSFDVVESWEDYAIRGQLAVEFSLE